MHGKKLFTALILLLMSSAAFAAKEASVRSQAEKAFSLLKKNLNSEKDLEARFKLLATFETSVKNMRAGAKRQDEDDEIYLDQLQEGLKLIPRKSGFNTNGCESQRVEILFNLEPTAEKKAKQPAVAQTLEALELVGRCSMNTKK